MSDLVGLCSDYLGIERAELMRLSLIAPNRMRRDEIYKRSGGKRVIWQAAIETKGIHYSLIENYLNDLPVDKASQAFSLGSSIKKNAHLHLGNRYFLRVDFKDFFPSIDFNSFKKIVQKNASRFNFETTSDACLLLLRGACFDRELRLPIGYATSPFIANATMQPFDEMLRSKLSDSFGLNTFVYTRYADDIVLSTNVRGVSRKAYSLLEQMINFYPGAKLSVNRDKTHFGSTLKGTAYVTGVHMLPDGRTAATKQLRNKTRFLLSLLKVKRIPPEEYSSLIGLLAHIRHIDPAFYTKLASDYYSVFPSHVPTNRPEDDRVTGSG